MNNIICYFNSNYVDIKKNKKITRVISKSIIDGDIVNKEVFINELKDRKIFSNVLSNSVIIYLNHSIEEKDELYYKSIFDELNCNNIKLYDTSNKLISPTLINSNNIYILYYKNKYYKVIPELLNDFLNLYKIDEIKIISKNKIPLKTKTRHYYYNYNNDNFIE